MVLLLPKHGAQHQCIDTTLPTTSDGGILRQLLQNADDVGATSIEFILDLSYHPRDLLLHPSLSKYQGPSLLVYSNSVSSLGDLEALSCSGRSINSFAHNPIGEYTRKFNSVYNWTNSPSVLSGSYFLILDPHLKWSSDLGSISAGGAIYDFVEHFGKQEMRNQLSAFEAVEQDFSTGFIGTIIRIPLRTDEQVERSVIDGDDRYISPEDILSAFSKFRDEMDESLLFLRKISSITLKVAGEEEVYAKSEILGVASYKESVANAFQAVFVDQSIERSGISFSVSICSHIRGRGERLLTWKIFHYLHRKFGGDSDDSQLIEWGKTQKLFPWVAFAALDRVEECGMESCIELAARLFTVLPLPIHTHQPLDIHGMFSLTEDCTSINQAQENSDIYCGLSWNTRIFEGCLAFAWPLFLEELAQNSASVALEDGFRYWPREVDHGELLRFWSLFMEAFIGVVIESDLRIWPTCQGWLSAEKVFLVSKNDLMGLSTRCYNPEMLGMLEALEDVGIPIIYPPDEIYDGLKRGFERAGAKILTPLTAAQFLQVTPEKLECSSGGVRQKVLGYLLSGSGSIGYSHLDGIKLFPMCDGAFAASGALSPPVLMLPNDDHERNLFNLRPHMTIDIKKVRARELSRIREDIGMIQQWTTLKQWAIEEVPEYFAMTYFSGLSPWAGADVIEAGDISGSGHKFSECLRELWDWVILQIEKRDDTERLLALLGHLWIIPVMGGRYRRVKPITEQLVIDPYSHKSLGSFLKSVCDAKNNAYTTNLLYYTDGLSPGATQFLKKHMVIRDCGNLEAFMDWLEYRSDFVSLLSSQERNELTRHLEVLSNDFFKVEITPSRRYRLVEQLRKLPVFEEIRNSTEGTNMNWVTLGKFEALKYVAVMMESVVPNIDGVVFINAKNPSHSVFIKSFGLAEVPGVSQLLEEYVLPSITTEVVPDIAKRLAVFSLDNIAFLSDESIADMAKMRFVPVKSRTGCGMISKSLKAPWECIDPGSSLGELFFAHERVWVDDGFWRAYSGELARMGLMKVITTGFILNRVRVYSGAIELTGGGELLAKIKSLFSLSANLEIPALGGLERKPWLPAIKHCSNGEDRFVISKPEGCRDESYMDLVGYSMPILPFRVSVGWMKALGWDRLIPPAAIKEHLEAVVERKEFLRLGIILDYLTENIQAEGYLNGFRGMRWIPGVSGGIFKAEDIYFRQGEELSPWCDCIVNELGCKYKPLFEFLGVQEKPSLPKLVQHIYSLDGGGPLKKKDLDLAIRAILLSTELYPKETFTGLKLPDYMGTLHDLATLTAGAPEYCESEVFFLHPRISRKAIEVLGIPSLDQRKLGDSTGMINFDIDTNYPQSNTRVNIIINTMGHYAIESTFNEYLANAEGLGTATRVGWVLDRDGGWDKTSILTEELADAMGPALLYWSDGVLADKDLNELINTAQGSKNKELAGCNSGTLTMYHWTSLPQIISGEYFIILDPEGKHLPFNRHTKCRHVCMKIRLQKMREHYPDHLKPFYGTLNFGPRSSYLVGMIFRLPFRNPKVRSSSIILDGPIIDAEGALHLMRGYLTDAKLSLLFLTRINSIEFRIRDSEAVDWGVTVTRGPMRREILDGVIQQLFVETRQLLPSQAHSIIVDEWRLAHREVPDTLVPQKIRAAKGHQGLKAKCGAAALISNHYVCSGFEGRFFTDLPLRQPSGLPVHIRASFIVAGGRKLVPLEGEAIETGHEWNTWILEYGVVELYLHFLQHLVYSFGKFSLKFWPAHKGLSNQLSNRLGKRFWEMVLESGLELFPIRVCGLGRSAMGLDFPGEGYKWAQRGLPLKEVVFDLLEARQGAILHTFLERMGVENIVRPTAVIFEGLQQFDPAQVVKIDPQYISCLLKRNEGENILYEMWMADDYSFHHLGPILEFMVKGSKHLPGMLTGYQIIPLADQTLGVLGKPGGYGISQYYISKNRVLNLFDYAPGLAIHPDTPQEIVDILLELDLNVSILPFIDLPRIFTHLKENEKTTTEFYHFLLKFWISIRYQYEVYPGYNFAVLSKSPIHSTLINGQLGACSPEEFNSLPAIVLPNNENEVAMCSKLPGLYLVDPRTISSEMEIMEKLTELGGLMRFIEVVGKLAKRKHITPEMYLSSSLEPEHITLLRKLLGQVINESVIPGLLGRHAVAVATLKSLPLWPAMGGKLISAVDALLVPDPRFCASWIGGQQLFVEPGASQEYSVVLELLGVKRLIADEFINEYGSSTLSRELGPDEVNQYRAFMEASTKYVGNIASHHALALDGNYYLRPSKELYDHSEMIFTSAFQDCLKSSFLHPDFQYLKNIFKPGLKSEVNGASYYECAMHISTRAQSLVNLGLRQMLRSNAADVFEYLRRNEGNIIQQWSASDFDKIRRVQHIPLFGNDSLHSIRISKRDQASTTPSSRMLGCFDDCVLSHYRSICWSQCPMYAKPPGAKVLQCTSSKGVPSVKAVLGHIEYLAIYRNEARRLGEARLIGEELAACYKFLNDHYSDPSHALEKVRDIDHRILDTVMWLNIDESITDANADLFRTSWASAKDLYLGMTYDFGHYKFVRRILASYESLLQALEVETVQEPKLDTTEMGQFKNAFENLYIFYQEGKLCDAELSVNGAVFKIHCAVLASGSLYWERIFTGNWKGADGGKISIKGAKPCTVSAMLHFLYTGSFPSLDSRIKFIEDLDLIMDCLKIADEWDMLAFKSQIEQKIVLQGYVRPESVRQILGIAKDARAKSLLKFCEQGLMTPMERLPVELLQRIFCLADFSHNERLACRLVCRGFCSVLNPEAFRRVRTSGFNRDALDRLVNLSQSSIANFVVDYEYKLTPLTSLKDIHDVDSLMQLTSDPGPLSVQDMAKTLVEHHKTHLHQVDILGTFYDILSLSNALPAFVNLKSVTISRFDRSNEAPHSFESATTRAFWAVIKALNNCLSRVESLKIDSLYYSTLVSIPPSKLAQIHEILENLKYFSILSVSVAAEMGDRDVRNVLQEEILLRMPKLEILRIGNASPERSTTPYRQWVLEHRYGPKWLYWPQLRVLEMSGARARVSQDRLIGFLVDHEDTLTELTLKGFTLIDDLPKIPDWGVVIGRLRDFPALKRLSLGDLVVEYRYIGRREIEEAQLGQWENLFLKTQC